MSQINTAAAQAYLVWQSAMATSAALERTARERAARPMPTAGDAWFDFDAADRAAAERIAAKKAVADAAEVYRAAIAVHTGA